MVVTAENAKALTEFERRKIIAEQLAQGVIRCQLKEAEKHKRQKQIDVNHQPQRPRLPHATTRNGS